MAHYNLFISHAWQYSEHYEKVVSWINEAEENGLFTWSNFSVPKSKSLIDTNSQVAKKILRGEIDQQIRPASLVIILSGMYVSYSDWIEYEITYAESLGKTIIGVRPWGNERTPQIVQDYAHTIVGWNSKSLIDAILDLES